MATKVCGCIHFVQRITFRPHVLFRDARFLSSIKARPTASNGESDASLRKKEYVNERGRTFVDLRRVLVRGGGGGRGCVSWFREPWVRFKRPDGSNGGNGGDVHFVASDRISTLDSVPITTVGVRGKHGRGKGRTGANLPPTEVLVPLGTIVYDVDGEELTDLILPGDRFVAAQGGIGGRGNGEFENGDPKTRIDDVEDPRILGSPGTEARYTLELKTIADVGLVGLPNAGKSTFLGAVSRAHPKVADYPFTTLNPHLGVVEFADHFRFTMADIPGLAIGAAQNVGLGHSFLRHIERSGILLYIVDMSNTNGALQPCVALDALREELKQYNPALLRKPALIAANKMDCGENAVEMLQELKNHTDIPVIPLSSKYGKGVKNVTTLLRRIVMHRRDEEQKSVKPKQSFSDFLQK
eukprot:m.287582 g.287582  ORF g.287582 m.287582 type:complete len:412 (+) comp19950_c0_seq1:294-1529(+)